MEGHVDDGEVVPALLGEAERLGSGSGLGRHFEALFLFEQLHQPVPHDRVVVHDEQTSQHLVFFLIAH